MRLFRYVILEYACAMNSSLDQTEQGRGMLCTEILALLVSLATRTFERLFWWAHQDLNLGPLGYEPIALTAELWAHLRFKVRYTNPVLHGNVKVNLPFCEGNPSHYL